MPRVVGHRWPRNGISPGSPNPMPKPQPHIRRDAQSGRIGSGKRTPVACPLGLAVLGSFPTENISIHEGGTMEGRQTVGRCPCLMGKLPMEYKAWCMLMRMEGYLYAALAVEDCHDQEVNHRRSGYMFVAMLASRRVRCDHT